MKISDIAKKFNLSIKEVREYAKEFGFAVAQKSQTMSDKRAREFIKELEARLHDRAEKPPIEAVIAEKPLAKEIAIPDFISVKDFSERVQLPVTKVITELMKNGVMASINENIDFATAEIVGEFLGFHITRQQEYSKATSVAHVVVGTKTPRPPVVTIIGHVDHGKTSLLDRIRATNIVGEESGGITQHIGAYQVEKRDRKITFLDTPGHAAFSAMREHGVRITDIAILVVAADDGVKPQTKESIIFARDAGVPVVVAINKIDKEGINIERVKAELAETGLVPEEWGGSTVIATVSAKTGQGIDELLDMVLLVADMKKTESYIDVPANGFVIESRVSASKGPLATVLIRDGVLRIGDALTVGRNVSGKVRTMTNYLGVRVKEAGPSMPVRITGLSAVPHFGELLEVENSLKEAKAKVEYFRRQGHVGQTGKIYNLKDISSSVKSGEIHELRIIIKTDVVGSLQAIRDAIGQMNFERVAIRIVSSSVGEISESDIKMAIASRALVIGFRVGASSGALKLASAYRVAIEIFSVIYELIDKVVLALGGLLEPEIREIVVGKGSVLKIFKDNKRDKILGVRVNHGLFKNGISLRVMRGDEEVAHGSIVSLKRSDDVVQEAGKGVECGIGAHFRTDDDSKVLIQEGDEVIAFQQEEHKSELVETQ